MSADFPIRGGDILLCVLFACTIVMSSVLDWIGVNQVGAAGAQALAALAQAPAFTQLTLDLRCNLVAKEHPLPAAQPLS